MGRRCGSIPPAARPPVRPPAHSMRDLFGRPLRSLRISVTDRCNMRGGYCMPEDVYVWLPRESILSFEEIERRVRVLSGLGVDKVRLTGGEPLLRHELATLVAMLDRVPGLKDLALTTNGLLLAREAEALRRAGLARVTVSLDTLRPARMREFAKSTRHDDVVAGIQAARQVGFRHLKLNTVVVRGFNDDEQADLIEFGRSHDAEVRFIEYMDVGGATRWTTDQVVPQREILERLTRRYGSVEPVGTPESPAAPAVRFRLPDGTVFGVIASVTAPFCGSGDRSRPPADGTRFPCLYAAPGGDPREPPRRRAAGEELTPPLAGPGRGRSRPRAEAR